MLTLTGFILLSFEMPFKNVISAKQMYKTKVYICHFKTKVNSTVSTFFHEMRDVSEHTVSLKPLQGTCTG